MRWFKRIVGLIALLQMCSAHAQQAPRVTVLELYTSEGCSSCPPAEAQLAKLAQRPDVIALAFHVDYWDELGWRDRFELPEAAQRQYLYAGVFGRSSVYTPQFIVNGTTDSLGSGAQPNTPALEESGWRLSLWDDEGTIQVQVSRQAALAPAEVTLVSYREAAVTAIGRGENQGRTLSEAHIVRSIEVLGRVDGALRTLRVARSHLPADATSVVALIQRPGPGPILAAARLALH